MAGSSDELIGELFADAERSASAAAVAGELKPLWERGEWNPASIEAALAELRREMIQGESAPAAQGNAGRDSTGEASA